MKKVILSFSVLVVLLFMAVAAVKVAAKSTESCPMCGVHDGVLVTCSMCDTNKVCRLASKGKDAHYCCSSCGDTKANSKDCQMKCSEQAK